jgi:hypothetical protein
MNRSEICSCVEPVYEKRSAMLGSGWRALADAIILQATDDYRRLTRRLIKHPDELDKTSEKRLIERFLCSTWFGVLSDLDGRRLLRDLKADLGGMEGVQ